jgi:predicted enzyme related to lactoylglutathione lyase
MRVNILTRRRSFSMAVTGPDFISLQARDLERSAAFYEQYLGLVRSPAGPPHAVVFETKPIAFALRDLVPGVDLDAVAQPGIGAALWLHADDVQAIHDALVTAGTTIVSAPIDGPFGRTFTFADPDGYQITLHDRG